MINNMTDGMKNELKAKFFGMHIGCEAICRTCKILGKEPAVVTGVSGTDILLENGRVLYFDDAAILLKPLADITDEDAISCAMLSQGKQPKDFKGLVVKTSDSIMVKYFPDGVSGACVFSFHVGRFCQDGLVVLNNPGDSVEPCNIQFCIGFVVDYLRSQGYCLPYMGLDPVVEGWAVLDVVPKIINP